MQIQGCIWQLITYIYQVTRHLILQVHGSSITKGLLGSIFVFYWRTLHTHQVCVKPEVRRYRDGNIKMHTQVWNKTLFLSKEKSSSALVLLLRLNPSYSFVLVVITVVIAVVVITVLVITAVVIVVIVAAIAAVAAVAAYIINVITKVLDNCSVIMVYKFKKCVLIVQAFLLLLRIPWPCKHIPIICAEISNYY